MQHFLELLCFQQPVFRLDQCQQERGRCPCGEKRRRAQGTEYTAKHVLMLSTTQTQRGVGGALFLGNLNRLEQMLSPP